MAASAMASDCRTVHPKHFHPPAPLPAAAGWRRQHCLHSFAAAPAAVGAGVAEELLLACEAQGLARGRAPVGWPAPRLCCSPASSYARDRSGQPIGRVSFERGPGLEPPGDRLAGHVSQKSGAAAAPLFVGTLCIRDQAA